MFTGGKVPQRFGRLPPSPALTCINFSDHQGRPRYRLWYPAQGDPTESNDGDRRAADTAPPFSLQVYVLGDAAQIYSKRHKLVNHLFGSSGGALRELPVCIEVYSTTAPDPFSCIEHQRGEIAHRAQNEHSERTIPRYRRSKTDGPHGFLILLSRRVLENDASNAEGPVLVTFDRHESQSAIAAARHPLGEDEDPADASSSDTFDSLEVACYRCREPDAVVQTLITLVNASGAEVGADYRYEPRDATTEGLDLLSRAANAFSGASNDGVDFDVRLDGAGRSFVDLTRGLRSTDAPADLRYIIYAPAGAFDSTETLTRLTATGHALLAALQPHWPSSLTFHLSLHAAPTTPTQSASSAIGTILDHLAAEHAANGDLSTGYLLASDSVGARSGAVRRVPGPVIAGVEAPRRFREFERFAVVLEPIDGGDGLGQGENHRVEVGEERLRVFFVLDGMRQWQMEMGIASEAQSGFEVMVRRPVGVRALARRLAGLE